ncbi:RhuM family protein [Novosphingobium sp. fls2-241-R2A-195]|uniref:RhuM family protein n=1 Tax=Novosphingobium sp. fls2-241-R2A-195 TaxID=3040296 RepID=UPI00254A05B8|nr:RhuM family protein [Novosphingobium sp. fls2-241-R2A-195]
MTDSEPVVLQEDESTGDRFLVYSTDKGLRLDIRYEGETLWMTQAQISELFGVSRQAVNSHVNNIYDEGELDREATCKEILQVRIEGEREVSRRTFIHNLDAIIAIGYRVSTKQGTLFRRWATEKLVQFAVKGFVIDSVRLKQPENSDRLAELREIIRDIRSDEANVYRELRRICAMCQDYDGDSERWREFYKNTQAKIVYAVTSMTPAELIRDRADAEQPHMGLRSWPNDNIRKNDVTVSKNYFGDPEVKELNRLTNILLDIFEDQAEIGRLVMMNDAQKLLDQNLKNLGRVVLTSGGHVSKSDADRHAEQQYKIYDEKRKAERRLEADRAIATLREQDKALPKTRGRPRAK